MIDERHEELASLYALDLLEGAERAQFETALERDSELQALVRELRHTTASLSHTAPAAQPPTALKERVLASIARTPASASAPAPVVDFPSRARVFIPWAVAACLALTAAWLGQRFLTTQSQATLLRNQLELAGLTLRSTQQQLEAERILNGRQVQDASQRASELDTQLGAARNQLGERDRLLAEVRTQLADRERQLADIRTRLTDRENALAALTQRTESLANTSADAQRQLAEAKQHVAQLTNELKSQVDLADLKITALASMLKNSPEARAIAVWDPKAQEGILTLENLPALAANEDYQVWIVDPQYPNPVDGGVFHVTPANAPQRLTFKAKQPIQAVNAFAITRERKGGVPKAEGPMVLLGK